MAAGGLFRFAMQRVFGFRFLAQGCNAADTSDHRQRENGKFELLTLHGKKLLKMCSSSNPSHSSNRNRNHSSSRHSPNNRHRRRHHHRRHRLRLRLRHPQPA